MSKVAVVTDTNSGISKEEAKRLGIFIVPMPFFIDDELFIEGETLSGEQFYEKQIGGADIKTSQPSPLTITEIWDDILKDYDEIIYIPMASSLSKAYETAVVYANNYDGKIHVLDILRISVTQMQAAVDAINMVNDGLSAKEICTWLKVHKLNNSIYLTVEDLKYLKKGGRVTATAAAIATVLNIKPVLKLHDDKIDLFAKVRGIKAAKKNMLNSMEKDLNTMLKGMKLNMWAVVSRINDEAIEWQKEVQSHFPEYEVGIAELSLSVATHTGPGVFAIATCERYEK
ncbi:MAG: DegV family protein [Lachnospiraceae bacterium]|jgi:DegV family protein with EDD domain|nr:DegV family protein [Lachnospiraceae bacterium]